MEWAYGLIFDGVKFFTMIGKELWRCLDQHPRGTCPLGESTFSLLLQTRFPPLRYSNHFSFRSGSSFAFKALLFARIKSSRTSKCSDMAWGSFLLFQFERSSP
eukprot:Blabericola_migrator_1__4858@NODE_2544_length_2625_cov_8_788116_g1591_i0_p2_GENE_NODE_2544_length_2625_cov_8_788116_g1591_i0NODE_2544_length_2625_cov_8_788116_g1591_i0_p2_ORF_typecomplete_len103_score5_12_NODE_2544_length_2625_cov_8_788116_g1591_i0283591